MSVEHGQQSEERPLINLGFSSERHPVGTHLCYVYNNDEERRKVMAKFINRGISDGEFIGYFADTEEAVDDYLEGMGIVVPDDMKEARSLLASARDTYCPDGEFKPERMLDNLRDLYQKCKSNNIPAARATGEMSWAVNGVPGSERLLEYEARANLVFEDHPITAICQYDANKFDGAMIFEILRVHPMMVVKGQIVHNPYFVPAREYLKELGLMA